MSPEDTVCEGQAAIRGSFLVFTGPLPLPLEPLNTPASPSVGLSGLPFPHLPASPLSLFPFSFLTL